MKVPDIAARLKVSPATLKRALERLKAGLPRSTD